MPSRNRSTKTPMRGLVVGVVVTTALVMIVMMIGPAAAWTIVPLTRQTRTTPPSTRLQLFFGRHPLRPPSHGDQNNNNNNDNEDNNNKNDSRPLGALSSSSASTPSSLPQQQQSSTPPPPPPLTFHELERRRMEFFELEPSIETARRKQRREREAFLHSKFAQGNELWNLRRDMDQLAWKLVHALLKRKSESATATDTQNSGSGSNNNAAAAAKAAAEEEAHTREQLRALEQRDPELVYGLEKAAFERANREGGHDSRAASIHRAKALAARSCLPHFNLEGLWVGKYGANGYELINVTYVGDTLVATKLTGDRNVPRGEITFQVDLNPLRPSVPHTKGSGSATPSAALPSLRGLQPQLQPIQLTDKAAEKWGTTQLARYPGLGQVAEDGFQNHQWMDGQLIVIGSEYFSFAWVPIEHQIFFGRPSPELALKLLREQGVEPFRVHRPQPHPTGTVAAPGSPPQPPGINDDVHLQKEFAWRCLEITHELQDDLPDDADALTCIWHGQATDECYFE